MHDPNYARQRFAAPLQTMNRWDNTTTEIASSTHVNRKSCVVTIEGHRVRGQSLFMTDGDHWARYNFN